MSNENIEVGQIYAECWGYSMVLYKFYRITRISEKFVWLQQLKTTNHPSTTDSFRPYVVPGEPEGKLIRKSIKRYFGNLWDGKPRQEDHLD